MRILFILLLHATFLQSQTPTFNLIQDYGYPVNHFLNVVVTCDTIVGMGVAYPDSFNLTQGVFLAKLDTNGTVLKTNLLFDANGDHLAFESPSRKIIKTKDGGYAFITAPYIRNNAIFFKLDADLEEEFRIEFVDTINFASFALRPVETVSGYLLYGNITKTNYQRVGVIRHITKTGLKVWEKQYTYNGHDNTVMEIKSVNDSTFVACSIIEIDADSYKGYSAIRTFDLQGNQLAYWESDVDSEEGYLSNIIPISDSGFIAIGKRLYQRTGNTEKVQSAFMRFDQQLNREWVRFWGKITNIISGLRVYDIVSDDNNGYLAFGKTVVNPDGNGPYSAGWVLKFSSAGDSIWARELLLPPGNILNSGKAFYGGGMLSSGSIIAGGYASIGWAYYGWIVKLSPDGCLDTLFVCQPTLAREQGIGTIAAFPNPAITTVRLLLPEGIQGHLIISDLTGRQVYTRHFADTVPEVDISVAGWAAGAYLVSVLTADGKLINGKLLIQR